MQTTEQQKGKSLFLIGPSEDNLDFERSINEDDVIFVLKRT